MSNATAVQYVPEDVYLAAERDATVRHEYVGGVLYAMAGASANHNLAAVALARVVYPSLRADGCVAFVSDMKVRVDRSRYYYPDVMVVCGARPADPYTQTSPCLIAEVLSPSTREVDMREKRAEYTKLPTLRHYLLIDPEARWVEVNSLTDEGRAWVSTVHLAGSSITLDCPATTFAVDDLFTDLR